MITTKEKRRTVEVKSKETDIVFEEESCKRVYFFGIRIRKREYDYKCKEKEPGKGIGY